jgi:hypothetical protein
MNYHGNNNQCDICAGTIKCQFCGNTIHISQESNELSLIKFRAFANEHNFKRIELIGKESEMFFIHVIHELTAEFINDFIVMAVKANKELAGGYPFHFSVGSFRQMLGDVKEIYSLQLATEFDKYNKIVAYRLGENDGTNGIKKEDS